jgi:hypothetical protein
MLLASRIVQASVILRRAATSCGNQPWTLVGRSRLSCARPVSSAGQARAPGDNAYVAGFATVDTEGQYRRVATLWRQRGYFPPAWKTVVSRARASSGRALSRCPEWPVRYSSAHDLDEQTYDWWQADVTSAGFCRIGAQAIWNSSDVGRSRATWVRSPQPRCESAGRSRQSRRGRRRPRRRPCWLPRASALVRGGIADRRQRDRPPFVVHGRHLRRDISAFTDALVVDDMHDLQPASVPIAALADLTGRMCGINDS